MNFYASYLCGQLSGMSDALSLPAVVAACDIEEVPREKRPLLTRMLIRIHAGVMEIQRREARRKSHG
jgi:hypothetical protein